MQAPHLRERQAIKRRSRMTDLHRRELLLISQNINIHTERTGSKSAALSRVAMSSPSFTTARLHVLAINRDSKLLRVECTTDGQEATAAGWSGSSRAG